MAKEPLLSPWVNSKSSIPFWNTKWCNVNLPFNHNLNSSHVKVSRRSNVSYLRDIYHTHVCSFNRVWMKCFHFLLVSRCCISIYTSTLCNHNHTHFVLVSFFVKESNNLTFILEHISLMTPNLSMIQLKSLANLLLCITISPHCTTNSWNALRRAKNSLDILTTSFGLAFSYVLRDLSTSWHSKASLPPFFLFQLIHKKNQGMHIPIWEMEVNVLMWPVPWFMNLFFPIIF